MTRASFIVPLALCMALCACDRGEGKGPAQRPTVEGERVVFPQGSPQLASLLTEVAKPGASSSLHLPGRLAWDEDKTVRLFPAFAGRVVRIFVKAGDVVKPGQILAQLASPDFGQAQADARKAASDFELAGKTLARVRELVGSGVAPQKELNAAEAEYGRAQAELARASARVRLYGNATATVDQSFALKSPIAGIVVERNINPGQELRSDLMLANAPPMFVVTDPSRLWVFLDATERDLPFLKPGQKVALHSDAYPDEAFSAVIDAVADFVDPQTRTIKVRGSLVNRDRRLKGEMFVTAQIETPAASGVLVPAKAVFLQGAHHFVFVEEAPGRYAHVEVEIGAENDGSLPVIAGLREGQRVVVDGNLFLQQLFQAQRHT